MFSDDAAPGWGPSLLLGEAWKRMLRVHGMNADASDHAWTGKTADIARTEFLIPGWA